jgi:hypothetical protein
MYAALLSPTIDMERRSTPVNACKTPASQLAAIMHTKLLCYPSLLVTASKGNPQQTLRSLDLCCQPCRHNAHHIAAVNQPPYHTEDSI